MVQDLQLKKTMLTFLEVRILNGKASSDSVFIHIIPLGYIFSFKLLQLPVKQGFAVTINKCPYMWLALNLQNRSSPMANIMCDFQESAFPNIYLFIPTRKDQKCFLSRGSVKLIRNNQSSGVYDLTLLFVCVANLLLVDILFNL